MGWYLFHSQWIAHAKEARTSAAFVTRLTTLHNLVRWMHSKSLYWALFCRTTVSTLIALMELLVSLARFLIILWPCARLRYIERIAKLYTFQRGIFKQYILLSEPLYVVTSIHTMWHISNNLLKTMRFFFLLPFPSDVHGHRSSQFPDSCRS